MQNEKSQNVLKAVVELSGGTFKVLDAEDIIEKIEGEKPQRLELSGIIKALQEQGLVTVKSASLDTYCIASKTRAKLVLDGTEIADETNSVGAVEGLNTATESESRLRTTTVVELDKVKGTIKRAAFFGALIGGAVVGVVVAAVMMLIK